MAPAGLIGDIILAQLECWSKEISRCVHYAADCFRLYIIPSPVHKWADRLFHTIELCVIHQCTQKGCSLDVILCRERIYTSGS